MLNAHPFLSLHITHIDGKWIKERGRDDMKFMCSPICSLFKMRKTNINIRFRVFGFSMLPALHF